MKKVYIVFSADPYDQTIYGVFSSEKKARRWADEQNYRRETGGRDAGSEVYFNVKHCEYDVDDMGHEEYVEGVGWI